MAISSIFGNFRRELKQQRQHPVILTGFPTLKIAAEAFGQRYNGSHGLRWNFARERFSELQTAGASYERCLGTVSSEMGHHRIEIPRRYLGL